MRKTVNSKSTSNRRRKKKNKKKKTFLLLAIIILALIFFFLKFFFIGDYEGLGGAGEVAYSQYNPISFYYEDGFLRYEDDNYTSKVGIDVSEHQKDIDWGKVKDAGIDFAFIRVGYRGWHSGEIKKDAYFDYNLSEAKKHGIKVGVYFYSQATTIEEAEEEANFVVREIFGKGLNYPVAFDMETADGTERAADLSVEEKTEIADAFLTTIDKYGYDTILYGNPAWFHKHIDLEYLSDYPLWLAHYTTDYTFQYDHSFWQYSDIGTVEGIKGNVDLNVELVKKKGAKK